MSVCNGPTIEIYGFMHSLHTFLACSAQGAIAILISRNRTRRIEDDSRLENLSRDIENS